jgi:hypothetical protein
MNNRLLVSVAAIALIGGVGAVSAQGGMNREGGAAMQQSTPSGGGHAGGAATQKGTEQSYGQKSTQSEPKTSGAAKGQRAEDNARGEKSKNLNTENRTTGSAKTEGREGNMKAEGREGPNKNLNAQGREGTNKNLNAQGREGTNSNMNAQGREGTNKNLNAEGRETNRSQVTTGQAGGGAKLSTEQRSRITTVIRNEHVAPINNPDFSIAVGSRVPREHVSLRALPSEVVTIYPQWRGYEFFMTGSEIIVVDPRTLEIVAVLPA